MSTVIDIRVAAFSKALDELCTTFEAFTPEHRSAAVQRQLAPFRAVLATHGIHPATEGASHGQDRHRT